MPQRLPLCVDIFPYYFHTFAPEKTIGEIRFLIFLDEIFQLFKRNINKYIHLTRYPSIYKLFNDIFIGALGLEDVQLLLGGGVALRRKCQCGPVNEGKDGSFGGMKVTSVKGGAVFWLHGRKNAHLAL